MNRSKALLTIFFAVCSSAAQSTDNAPEIAPESVRERLETAAEVAAMAAPPALPPGAALPAALSQPAAAPGKTSPSQARSAKPAAKPLPPEPMPAATLSSAALDSPEKKALDKAMIENQLFQAELSRQLQKLTKEKEEFRAQADLLSEKLRLELIKIENTHKLDTAKVESKYRLKLAELETEQKKLSAENQLLEERFKAEIARLRQDKDRLKIDNDLKDEQLRASDQTSEERRKVIDMELRELDFKSKKLKFEEDQLRNMVEKLRIEGDKLRTEADKLKTELEVRAKKEEWKSEANKEPDYLKNPFAKGVLTVTDRRISLNGPIVTGVADYVTDRIDYYNNKSSELPIFIVIDRSPGGSVMEGYRIVKAMQASKAPVHVVVKSFAASMAAVIATLAQESYAYPNAVILHHQMSGMQWGNMTQLKEQLEIAREWYRRLAEPVSRKMGISIDQFTRQMYSHNSDGDWQEFGDKAVALKWVANIVHEVRETGVLKDPEKADKSGPPNKLEEKVDEKGQRYVTLPRIDPFDLYWIYNPDKYYR